VVRNADGCAELKKYTTLKVLLCRLSGKYVCRLIHYSFFLFSDAELTGLKMAASAAAIPPDGVFYVEGAGYSKANGWYKENGTYNDKPQYVHVNDPKMEVSYYSGPYYSSWGISSWRAAWGGRTYSSSWNV
jgi:hypothetical protein